MEWDRRIMTSPEDWPTMMGRLNAALNQTKNLDRSIDDVWEHFVYIPKKATANPQDVPFFLSTRLEMNATPADQMGELEAEVTAAPLPADPVRYLATFENEAARLAVEYEQWCESEDKFMR